MLNQWIQDIQNLAREEEFGEIQVLRVVLHFGQAITTSYISNPVPAQMMSTALIPFVTTDPPLGSNCMK